MYSTRLCPVEDLFCRICYPRVYPDPVGSPSLCADVVILQGLTLECHCFRGRRRFQRVDGLIRSVSRACNSLYSCSAAAGQQKEGNIVTSMTFPVTLESRLTCFLKTGGLATVACTQPQKSQEQVHSYFKCHLKRCVAHSQLYFVINVLPT